jgi:hypothetical protein
MSSLPKLRFSSSGGNYITGATAIKAQFPAVSAQVEAAEDACQQTGLECEFRARLKLIPGNVLGGYFGPGPCPGTLVENLDAVDFILLVPHLALSALGCQGADVKMSPILRSRAAVRSALLGEMTELAHRRGFQVSKEELEHVITAASTVTVGFQAEVLLSAVTTQLFGELRSAQL